MSASTSTGTGETIILRKGAHGSREEGMCVMEAAAFIAGEPHSDQPQCVCPVITRFLSSWNDALRSDEARTRLLLPLIPHILGTRSTPGVERARAWMATDWLAREQAPAWLELAQLPDYANALRSCAQIVDADSARAAQPVLTAARAAAWDAAGDAVGAAAGAAAWDAAGAAAGDAAWDVARDAAWDAAAGDAAWDAAWDAAGAAAGDAVGAAAWDALAPTVAALQASAQRLVIRMCEVNE